jgi:hypothetical protein
MIGNSGSGIGINTVHNLTLDGCTIKDNPFSQVEITNNANRRDGVLYTDTNWYPGWVEVNGSLVQANNRVITDVVNMVVKNSTLTTTRGASSRIYWNENNSDAGYVNWGVHQFTGSNNTYFNSATAYAFLRNRDEYIDFNTWKSWTGTDFDSRWGASSTGVNLVSNGDFEADGVTQTPSGWSEWNNVDASATAWGGAYSGNVFGAHYRSTAYEVSTYQFKTGLANGNYTFRAYVKSSGGQVSARLFAHRFNSTGTYLMAERNYWIGDWTLVTIPNIAVTNGQCEIGFYSKTNGNQSFHFDKAEFFMQ